MWSLKPPGFHFSPPESTRDGLLLPPSIVSSLDTARERAVWGWYQKLSGDDIMCTLFERHDFSTGLEIGGPPFPYLDSLFLISAEELPFTPLLASDGRISAPAILGGLLVGTRLIVLLSDSLPNPLPQGRGYIRRSLPPRVGHSLVWV